MMLLALLLMAAISCSGPRTFLNEQADWTFYQRLGVLPFINLTADRFAGEKVQASFITELFLTDRFEVVEPGEFNAKAVAQLKVAGVQPTQELPLDQIKIIGEKTGVQGVVEGIVTEYSMIRVGQADYPLISLNMRLIDVPTGTVVWMASYSKKGGPNLPIISIGETHTLSELTQDICNEIVSDFVGKAF
jgi:curli biogenesis system outer membrane secretion channel CsgG